MTLVADRSVLTSKLPSFVQSSLYTMSPVAVPPTEADTSTPFKGASPDVGFTVVVTERVLSVGAETLQVPEPEH